MSRLEALRDRPVLVTGHTGFKGSWLSLWLAQLGARVTGYALPPPTEPSNFAASGVREVLVGHVEGDVRDREGLARAVRQASPEVIFHLAAQPLVRASYREPAATFDTNVMGTVNLLEAVRQLGRPCAVVVVTSDKCYENREHVWGYRESDAMGGHDPYSASKGAAELVVGSYQRAFFPPERLQEHGVKLASARAGNVIGGGDWAAERLVTDVVRCLRAGEPVPLRNPRAVRPWQHVLEPLDGYLTLAARLLESDAPELCSGWNFGPLPGQEAQVVQVVDRFCQAWGGGRWEDVSTPGQLHEAHSLRLSVDKAIAQLGWRPRWSLDAAVERTARWYRRYFEEPGRSMRQACLEDLAAHQAAGRS